MKNTKKSFGQIWSELTSEQTEYLKNYINKQRQDAVKEYKAEQLRIGAVSQQRELLIDFCNVYAEADFESTENTESFVDWFIKVKDN